MDDGRDGTILDAIDEQPPIWVATFVERVLEFGDRGADEVRGKFSAMLLNFDERSIEVIFPTEVSASFFLIELSAIASVSGSASIELQGNPLSNVATRFVLQWIEDGSFQRVVSPPVLDVQEFAAIRSWMLIERKLVGRTVETHVDDYSINSPQSYANTECQHAIFNWLEDRGCQVRPLSKSSETSKVLSLDHSQFDSLVDLGRSAVFEERYEDAVMSFASALTLADTVGNPLGMIELQIAQCELQLKLGESASAVSLELLHLHELVRAELESAKDESNEWRLRFAYAVTKRISAECFRTLGETTLAVESFEAAAAEFVRVNNLNWAGRCHLSAALCLLGVGLDSRSQFEDALESFDLVGNIKSFEVVRVVRSILLADTGNPEVAISEIRNASESLRSIGEVEISYLAICLLIKILVDLGLECEATTNAENLLSNVDQEGMAELRELIEGIFAVRDVPTRDDLIDQNLMPRLMKALLK